MGKQIVTLIIEDGRKASREVQACSKEDANLFITAPTLQTALTLLNATSTEKELLEAMQDWKPAPEEPEIEQKHYYTMAISMEEMDEKAAEYEGTYNGRRFMASVENSMQFYFKHGTGYGGISCTQLDYLANKHYNSLLNGSFDIFALGYRCGYKDAQKKARAI